MVRHHRALAGGVAPRLARQPSAAQAAGIGLFTGVFKKVTGSYTFDPKNPRADKADITIPVDGLDTFFPMRDEDLKGAAFFDAKANPDIHFVSTK